MTLFHLPGDGGVGSGGVPSVSSQRSIASGSRGFRISGTCLDVVTNVFIITETAGASSETEIGYERYQRPVQRERRVEAETGAAKIDRDPIRPAQ